MLFSQQPSPPPPPPTLTIELPAVGPYAIGLVFVIASQIVAVPLCVLAFNIRKGSALPLYLIGLVTAVLPLFVQPFLESYLVEHGWASRHDTLSGRFVGSTTYAFCAFRIFGAAVGATPKGADADVATWIAYATAAVDPLFDKETGKPIRPAATAVPARFGWLAIRMGCLSLVSSLARPYKAFPGAAYVAARFPNGSAPLAATTAAFVFDHSFIHLFMIYFFLSLLIDVGSLLLLVQGYQPLAAFDDPLFSTRNTRDFWGRRWNLQVTTAFKRMVFDPLRKKLQLSPALAASLTFVVSGLFHEYQFVLSMPTYSLGTISVFFVMHAGFSFLDALYKRYVAIGLVGLGLPVVVQSLFIMCFYSPSIPYFSHIWVEEGLFEVMSLMTPQIKYG